MYIVLYLSINIYDFIEAIATYIRFIFDFCWCSLRLRLKTAYTSNFLLDYSLFPIPYSLFPVSTSQFPNQIGLL